MPLDTTTTEQIERNGKQVGDQKQDPHKEGVVVAQLEIDFDGDGTTRAAQDHDDQRDKNIFRVVRSHLCSVWLRYS